MLGQAIPLDGFKVDTSVYTPTTDWDGCCWLDRDGTIIPVPAYASHHTVKDRLSLKPYEITMEAMWEAGYLHVSSWLAALREPTERQKDALFHLANHSQEVRKGIENGVCHGWDGVRWTL